MSVEAIETRVVISGKMLKLLLLLLPITIYNILLLNWKTLFLNHILKCLNLTFELRGCESDCSFQ